MHKNLTYLGAKQFLWVLIMFFIFSEFATVNLVTNSQYSTISMLEVSFSFFYQLEIIFLEVHRVIYDLLSYFRKMKK